MEIGKRNDIAGVAISEKAVEKLLFVGLESGPIGLRFLQMEDVLLGVSEAEKVIFLLLFDDEISRGPRDRRWRR